MLLTKFYRSLRKPRVTTLAGLVTFKRLTDQLGLLDSLEEPDFQKLYGHSLKSIFVAMLIKALMGCPSLNEFEKQLTNRPLIGKMADCTTKISKTVLGRNIKRFKPAFLRKTYENIIHKLLAQGIVTLRRVAIDCTFIEVFGETYQKATPGWALPGRRWATASQWSLTSIPNCQLPTSSPMAVKAARRLLSPCDDLPTLCPYLGI
ncbi:MAG: hypothetical protein ACE5OZ_20525 [Candidatus Heimdallarchaeota archaeon]